MKQDNKQTILNCISKVFEGAKGNQLKPGFLDQHDAELAIIAKFLDTDKPEAYFASLVFGLSCYHRSVDISDLFKHMDCNALELLQYNHVILALDKKGIVKSQGNNTRFNPSGREYNYVISKKVVDAILNNSPPGELKKTHFNDMLELLEHLWSLGEQLNADEIGLHELFAELERLLQTNKQLPRVKHILTFKLDEFDAFMYLMVIWDSLHGKEGIAIDAILRDLIRKPSQRIRHVQSFHTGENDLIRHRLVTLEEGSFLNDNEVVLTDHSRELLKSFGLVVNKRGPDDDTSRSKPGSSSLARRR